MAAVQNSLNLLSAYNESEEENNSTSEDSTSKNEEEKQPHDYETYKPADSSISVASSITIDAAPVVLYSVSLL
jgi:hypothetical protein